MQPTLETLSNETELHDRKHVTYAGRNPSVSAPTGFIEAHEGGDGHARDGAWRDAEKLEE